MTSRKHPDIDTVDSFLFIPAHLARIIEQVNERDRQYFRAHPGAMYRVRPFVPGEMWPDVPPPVSGRILAVRAPAIHATLRTVLLPGEDPATVAAAYIALLREAGVM